MEDEKARDDIVRLSAKITAIREMVARLLAYEAERASEPKEIFENYSTALDARIYSMLGDQPLPPTAIAYQELVRKEVDWIVGAAQHIVSAAKGR